MRERQKVQLNQGMGLVFFSTLGRGIRVQGSGFRVQLLEVKVKGSGCRVLFHNGVFFRACLVSHERERYNRLRALMGILLGAAAEHSPGHRLGSLS